MAALPRALPLLAASLLALLARPAAAQLADKDPFPATGEIRFRVQGGQSNTVSFNDARVVGPVVNVSKRPDGTWAGDLYGKDLDLKVNGTGELRIFGNQFLMVQVQKGDRTEVEGLLDGIRFRASVDAKKVTARFGDCSIDLERRGGVYRGDFGCLRPNKSLPETGRAVLDFAGEAGANQPPFPAFGIALLAVLPN